jgi:hypothetical protein
VNNKNAVYKAPGNALSCSINQQKTSKAGKTPAPTRTRRAHGDISNRKLDVAEGPFAKDAKKYGTTIIDNSSWKTKGR